MRGYKITDKNRQTIYEGNVCQWGENVTNTATGTGTKLCTDAFIHLYEDEFVAVFMNPIHGNYNSKTMRMFECEAEPVIFDSCLKCGAKTVTTIREIEVPVLTLEQIIEIGIHCALTVCKKADFVKWAEHWLDGSDRSAKSAWAVRKATNFLTGWEATYAAEEATYAAAAAAAAAAEAAARAARFAAEEIAENLKLSAIIQKVLNSERNNRKSQKELK